MEDKNNDKADKIFYTASNIIPSFKTIVYEHIGILTAFKSFKTPNNQVMHCHWSHLKNNNFKMLPP